MTANSAITSKFQTTVPKEVREELGLSVNDALEWEVQGGQAVVRPVHTGFLSYRNRIMTGAGDISADLEAARAERLEKYK